MDEHLEKLLVRGSNLKNGTKVEVCEAWQTWGQQIGKWQTRTAQLCRIRRPVCGCLGTWPYSALPVASRWRGLDVNGWSNRSTNQFTFSWEFAKLLMDSTWFQKKLWAVGESSLTLVFVLPKGPRGRWPLVLCLVWTWTRGTRVGDHCRVLTSEETPKTLMDTSSRSKKTFKFFFEFHLPSLLL